MAREDHPFVFSGLCLLCILCLQTQVRGVVTAVALSQHLETHTYAVRPAGLILIDDDVWNSSTFPPVSQSLVSGFGHPALGEAGASIDLDNYSGPMSPGANTPALAIAGTLFVSAIQGTAYSRLALQFSLNAHHTFTHSGGGSLTGPGGAFGGGSGVLAPGAYEFEVILSTDGGGANKPFSLNLGSVPEPSALSVVGLCSALLLSRRRS